VTPLAWDLLENLTDGEVDEVLALGTTRDCEPGEVLFDLGDHATGIFLVEKGLVRLTLPLNVGDRNIDALVGERLPGHTLGWSGLIPPHSFTVKASAEGPTRLRAVRREDLLELFAEKPELAAKTLLNAARIVGQRLQVFQTLWIREMQHVVRARRP